MARKPNESPKPARKEPSPRRGRPSPRSENGDLDVTENGPYEVSTYGPYGARGNDQKDRDYPGGFDERRRR